MPGLEFLSLTSSFWAFPHPFVCGEWNGNSITTFFSGNDFFFKVVFGVTKHFGNQMKPVEPFPEGYSCIRLQKMGRVWI